MIEVDTVQQPLTLDQKKRKVIGALNLPVHTPQQKQGENNLIHKKQKFIFFFMLYFEEM